MAQDPRTVVHSTTMLWGSQVALVDALNARDGASVDEVTELAGQFMVYSDKHRPWIYEFGPQKRKFVQPRPVYG